MARLTKNEPVSLADQIRVAAADSGHSVNHLAELAGVDQSTLNKFLNGQRPNVRLDIADRLCRVLGLTLTKTKTRKRPPREPAP